MRVAQYSGLREPGVFMTVSYDLNDDTSPFGPVHYRNKQDVGLRLSTAADYYVYATSNAAAVPFGPTARTVTSYLYGSDVLRVLIAYEGVGTGLLYSGNNLFELAQTEASTTAIPARMLLIVSRETIMLEFDLSKGNKASRVLRYALRNNPCPSAEVRPHFCFIVGVNQWQKTWLTCCLLCLWECRSPMWASRAGCTARLGCRPCPSSSDCEEYDCEDEIGIGVKRLLHRSEQYSVRGAKYKCLHVNLREETLKEIGYLIVAGTNSVDREAGDGTSD